MNDVTVITYSTTRGLVNMCGPCDRFASKHYVWGTLVGAEFQGVYHGAHRGVCETCNKRREMMAEKA
jgi:hypothetical protein